MRRTTMIKMMMLSLMASLLITGCSQKIHINQVNNVGVIPEREELSQGWSQEVREKFWFTSQGSRIIPYVWFVWLEQADNQQLFRDSGHMEQLRYLPAKSSKLNLGGLPIGFALDEGEDQDWVGLTCSACHTNQIDYQGKRMLVEGAPTLANFVLFFSELNKALEKTYQDETKFTRFAKNVLGDDYAESTAKALKEEVAEQSLQMNTRQAVNDLPSDYPADFTSYARLDAFGNIQNAASTFALHDLANKNAPTAPVSYPFLWGTHQSDVVQWNGSAPNTPIVGPLVRNIGEVVGVFGSLDMQPASWFQRTFFDKQVEYSSTVQMKNLGFLELWVKQLRSPAWIETSLPAIDTAKAAQGAVLYDQYCAQCHQVIPRKQEADQYNAVLTPVSAVGTDPAMSVNAGYHMAKTLLLEGTKESVLFGDKFPAVAPAIELAVNGVTGLVVQEPLKALESGLISTLGASKGVKEDKNSVLEKVKENISKRNELAGQNEIKLGSQPDLSKIYYKARPLNGIWATAPYLHNGSVPNLWELMKKPKQRSTTFWVGSREFDPVNVGFDTRQGLNKFKVYNEATQKIQAGNSNLGHDYGTDLSDQQKWAIVEYMKTL